MRRIAITVALLGLAACSEPEPESVENRARTLEAELQNRADELEAEASNGVAQVEAELNDEFANFEGETQGNAAANEAAEE
jgi:hypothetical protein